MNVGMEYPTCFVWPWKISPPNGPFFSLCAARQVWWGCCRCASNSHRSIFLVPNHPFFRGQTCWSSGGDAGSQWMTRSNCLIRDILVFFMGISKDDGDFLMQNATKPHITTAQPLGVMDLSVVSTDCPDFRCFFFFTLQPSLRWSDLDVSWPVQENGQTKLGWFINVNPGLITP